MSSRSTLIGSAALGLAVFTVALLVPSRAAGDRVPLGPEVMAQSRGSNPHFILEQVPCTSIQSVCTGVGAQCTACDNGGGNYTGNYTGTTTTGSGYAKGPGPHPGCGWVYKGLCDSTLTCSLPNPLPPTIGACSIPDIMSPQN